mgnify:CR=1 FL=1
MKSLSHFWLKQILTVLVVYLACFSIARLYAQSKEEDKDILKTGTAKIDITPQKPVKMSGYASRTELSQGVHDPLSARVVAFEKNSKRLILISTDLLGFYDGTADYLRKAILDEFKLAPAELFLGAIHTHAGPTPTMEKEG